MRPKGENEEDKKAREMERERAELERSEASQENAAGLTNDLNAVYGRGKSLFARR